MGRRQHPGRVVLDVSRIQTRGAVWHRVINADGGECFPLLLSLMFKMSTIYLDLLHIWKCENAWIGLGGETRGCRQAGLPEGVQG